MFEAQLTGVTFKPTSFLLVNAPNLAWEIFGPHEKFLFAWNPIEMAGFSSTDSVISQMKAFLKSKTLAMKTSCHFLYKCILSQSVVHVYSYDLFYKA